MTPDVEALRRRLASLIRAADRLRAHCPTLYSLAWEPHVGESLEGDAPGFASSPPRAGDPRARRLFARIVADVERAEADLVGLERIMSGLMFARAERPEPSRGSTIGVAEFDEKIEVARRRGDGHALLEPQPQHPGRRP